jgi:hypothetical protein
MNAASYVDNIYCNIVSARFVYVFLDRCNTSRDLAAEFKSLLIEELNEWVE